MYRHLLLFLLLALPQIHSLSAQAQVKYEKERRIRPNAAPSAARSFLTSLDVDGRIRWYREERLDGASIEAKFRHAGASYSVEFDTTVVVEDVETTIRREDLPMPAGASIAAYLHADCSKYNIVKIQRQYTGVKAGSFSLRAAAGDSSLTIRYELVVRCHRNHSAELYEYLFDHTGGMISTSLIVWRNSTHLEY
ncbi:MAG: hypothetical protein RLY31_1203 [Bacteroidota bacterium]